MRRLLTALGAAAIAVSAPALADKEEGKGGQGKDGGKGGQSAKADRGHEGHSMKADRGKGGDRAVRQADSGGRGVGKADVRRADDNRGNDRKDVARANRKDGRADREFGRDDQVRVVGQNVQNDFSQGRGLRNDCPPGLDKRDNGCLPPGQVGKLLGARLQGSFANSLVPQQYRSWYRDDDNHFYRAGDGFMYRVSRDKGLIDGIIPLFGGGGYYAMGDQWPDPYDFYNVPQQYRDYYADSGDYAYRYGDGAIYRVNSGSGVVDGIVALLAGDLGVGSRLPQGYDAYNVPIDYRDRYYDTPDNWYRYNDGYIYQVDSQTRLITAVIDALT
jgi:hypothetical protein